jgi:galactose-1-phosphate uridylyltransferase
VPFITVDANPLRVFSLSGMELRKDPITRSWVITGDDVPDIAPRSESSCRFCPDSAQSLQLIASMSGGQRAVVHPVALYHIEGEASRRADGIYDRMRPVGAHEVLIENPRHDGHLECDRCGDRPVSSTGGAAHSGPET